MPTRKQLRKLKWLISQRSISIMRGKKEFDTLHSLTQEQARELIYFLEYEWGTLSGYQFCHRVKELQEFFQFGIPVDRWRKECQRNSGFAVVANEIRQLADSSSKGANTIEDIIKELLSNSQESVKTMSAVSEDSDVQEQSLRSTQSAFEDLAVEITSVASAVDGISKQMKHLSETREVIVDAVESLSAVSEESAASTEETSAAMEELSAVVENCVAEVEELGTLSGKLGQLVSSFRL